MRQQLHLDFQQGQPLAHWSGALVLVTGLICAGITLSSHLALQAQIGSADQRVTAAQKVLRRQAPPPKPGAPSPLQLEQSRQANEVLALLGLPWQDALGQIEATEAKDLSLLSIEPDMQKGFIRLGGEAKSYQAILIYMKALQTRPGLSEVVLQTHNVEDQKPGTPTHFLITARWSAAR